MANDSEQEYIYFMGPQMCPSACYAHFDKHNITMYFFLIHGLKIKIIQQYTKDSMPFIKWYFLQNSNPKQTLKLI